jgi:hypothetical protein
MIVSSPLVLLETYPHRVSFTSLLANIGIVSPDRMIRSNSERTVDVNKAADEHGVIVVGGSSYSVGAAGGWILGGGHSSLSPQYGLGVDSEFLSSRLQVYFSYQQYHRCCTI